MRTLRVCAALVVIALALVGCGGRTETTSPMYPSPSAMLTELPAVNWPTPTDQHGSTPPPESTPAYVPAAYHCPACPTCEPTVTPTPTPTPPPTVTLEIYDCAGQITNTYWLTSTFGDVRWSEGNLVELRCSIGPSVLVANVRDHDSQPVENATVVLYWPDAPFLPPELQSCGLDRGVFGPTNQNGDIGFGLGPGSYYFPPSGGPHVMWVVGGASCLAGLGMLGLTEHQHLDSGWVLGGDQAEQAGTDWGYSTGAVVYEQTVNGRRMWVILAR